MTDGEALLDDGPDADPAALPNPDPPGEARAGRDVNAVGQVAIVVHGGPGVDDDGLPKTGTDADARPGEDDGAGLDDRMGADGRAGMDDRRHDPAQFRQSTMPRQPVPVVPDPDDHAVKRGEAIENLAGSSAHRPDQAPRGRRDVVEEAQPPPAAGLGAVCHHPPVTARSENRQGSCG